MILYSTVNVIYLNKFFTSPFLGWTVSALVFLGEVTFVVPAAFEGSVLPFSRLFKFLRLLAVPSSPPGVFRFSISDPPYTRFLLVRRVMLWCVVVV